MPYPGNVDSRRDDDPVVREYARLAARYDRRWSSYIDASVRETVMRLAAEPGEAVLDVGCGTGALLRVLAGRSPGGMRLAGVDPSPEMLRIAAGKLGSAAELKPGRAEALPFADGTFDAVVSVSVLHFLRRPGDALSEMGRILKPGGRVVVTDWCTDYPTCRLLDMALRSFDRTHVRAYRRAEFEALLTTAGFDAVEVDRYKVDWFWGLMTATGRKRRRRAP